MNNLTHQPGTNIDVQDGKDNRNDQEKVAEITEQRDVDKNININMDQVLLVQNSFNDEAKIEESINSGDKNDAGGSCDLSENVEN